MCAKRKKRFAKKRERKKERFTGGRDEFVGKVCPIVSRSDLLPPPHYGPEKKILFRNYLRCFSHKAHYCEYFVTKMRFLESIVLEISVF
jgi:hypothetical protein